MSTEENWNIPLLPPGFPKYKTIKYTFINGVTVYLKKHQENAGYMVSKTTISNNVITSYSKYFPTRESAENHLNTLRIQGILES